MKTYIIGMGSSAQKTFDEVFDFARQQPNVTINTDGSLHRKFFRVTTDNKAIADIRNFATGWQIEERIPHRSGPAGYVP